MLLQDKQRGTMIEVLEIEKLIDPTESAIKGRVQEGQEEQDPEPIAKTDLVFPSGETLPRCWLDADYRLTDS
jgi:hypothetical protein